MPLAGNVDETRADRLGRRAQRRPLAIQRHRTRPRRKAEDRTHDIGLAVALDTAEPDDLASPRGEGHILEQAFGFEVLDEEKLAPRRGCAQRIGERHFASDHHRNQALVIDFVAVDGADDFAVLQHGDAIGDREDFGQAVRDEDDRGAAPFQFAHDLEQLVDFCGVQRGGWLVENEDRGRCGQRARDLDDLPLGDG